MEAVTTRDAEWDDDERAWSLALLEAERDIAADTCPSCAGSLAETTDPANEFAYTVPPPTRCHRCTALARAQDRYGSDPAIKHVGALLWRTERT